MLAEFLRTGINRYTCIYSSFLKRYTVFFYANAMACSLTFTALQTSILRLSEELTVQ